MSILKIVPFSKATNQLAGNIFEILQYNFNYTTALLHSSVM